MTARKLLTGRGEQLGAMLVLATTRHAGQFDKGGKPYILHPLAVMYLLGEKADEIDRCIALGHDLVEDTDTTCEELRDLGFCDEIIEGIRALTKVPGETHTEYKAKVKANARAVRVKKCDLTHNTDIRRLRGATPKDMARTERYFHFYLELLALEEEPAK